MLDILRVGAFSDNYIWLVRAPSDKDRVVAVDPGDAAPVLDALHGHGLSLAGILITHHHWDHTNGVEALLANARVPVFAPADENAPVAGCTAPVRHGDTAAFPDLNLSFAVLAVPGHTAGHIAYHGHGAVFCGDALFSAGCGRLFEGTPEQMLGSLRRLAALPDETLAYCGHEYTASNLRFAAAVEPDNAAVTRHAGHVAALRREGEASLPTTIALERQINPFLRCDEAAVRDAAEAQAGRTLADTTAVLATLRQWKDNF
ncbi:MAG: hydroxyacylglutathione hydrolase [Pseudomonadota bacterium]